MRRFLRNVMAMLADLLWRGDGRHGRPLSLVRFLCLAVVVIPMGVALEVGRWLAWLWRGGRDADGRETDF